MEKFKSIKFNLILDGNYIYNIEELKNNFNIEDIYNCYIDGRLSKWLHIKGYNIEKKKVDNISKELNIKNQMESLLDIFGIEKDDKLLDVIIKEKENPIIKNEIHSIKDNDRIVAINDYFREFNFKIDKLVSYSIDEKNINNILNDLLKPEYSRILKISIKTLLNRIVDESPTIIYHMLRNEKLRPIVIENMSKYLITRLPIEGVNILSRVRASDKNIKIDKKVIILNINTNNLDTFSLTSSLKDLKTKKEKNLSNLIYSYLPSELHEFERIKFRELYQGMEQWSKNLESMYLISRLKELIVYDGFELETRYYTVDIIYLEV